MKRASSLDHSAKMAISRCMDLAKMAIPHSHSSCETGFQPESSWESNEFYLPFVLIISLVVSLKIVWSSELGFWNFITALV